MCQQIYPPAPAAPHAPAWQPAPPVGSHVIYAPVLRVPPFKPEPVETAVPESDAVITLRALVEDRRDERERVEQMRATAEQEADRYEQAAQSQREKAEQHAHHVAVADEAIRSLLADIEKLGGKPESLEE